MRVYLVLDRWLDRLYLGCGYIAAGLLVTLALLIVGSIVSRLLGAYVPGLTEYSGYAMAGASFLAFAYTLRTGGHIRVGLLLNTLTGRAHKGLQLWCLVMGSVFSTFLAFYLIKMTYVSWDYGERSEGADAILLWIPQMLVSFGASVLALSFLHGLTGFLLGRGDPTEPDDSAMVGEP